MRIAAVILAAGMAARMGRNKLLIEIDGIPLICRVTDAALGAGLSPVVAVTGHEANRVRDALGNRDVVVAHNPDYADGMAGSLKPGIIALPAETEGVLVCLGDMPDVTSTQIRQIAAAFDPVSGAAICVPTRSGKRGNPVLLGQRFFQEILCLTGDVGARGLIARNAEYVREVPMDDDAVLTDLDTAEALEDYGKRR